MNIHELTRVVDDGMTSSLGFHEKGLVLPWVSLDEIKGIDWEGVRKTNIENVGKESQSGVDDCIVEYLFISYEQNLHWAQVSKCKSPISEVTLLTELLEISVQLETDDIDIVRIPRNRLGKAELRECLSIFEEKQASANSQFRRERILDWCKYFFCADFVSPELSNLPEIEGFQKSTEFKLAVKRMSSIV